MTNYSHICLFSPHNIFDDRGNVTVYTELLIPTHRAWHKSMAMVVSVRT